MRKAQDCRDRAQLCLEIARQMSDRKAVESLKKTAEQYHAEAAAMDTKKQG